MLFLLALGRVLHLLVVFESLAASLITCFSGGCPIHPPCLVFLHSSRAARLQVLISSILLISFWIIWTCLLHHFAYGSSITYCLKGLFHSWFPLLEMCKSAFSRLSTEPGLTVSSPGFLHGHNAGSHLISTLHLQDCRLRKM